MDVIGAGKPVRGGLIPTGELDGNGPGFAGLWRKRAGGWGEEAAAMGFDFVVAGGQIKRRLSGMEEEVLLVVVEVDLKRKDGVDGVRAEGAVVLKKIDASGVVRLDGGFGGGLGLAVLGEGHREAFPVPKVCQLAQPTGGFSACGGGRRGRRAHR